MDWRQVFNLADDTCWCAIAVLVGLCTGVLAYNYFSAGWNWFIFALVLIHGVFWLAFYTSALSLVASPAFTQSRIYKNLQASGHMRNFYTQWGWMVFIHVSAGVLYASYNLTGEVMLRAVAAAYFALHFVLGFRMWYKLQRLLELEHE